MSVTYTVNKDIPAISTYLVKESAFSSNQSSDYNYGMIAPEIYVMQGQDPIAVKPGVKNGVKIKEGTAITGTTGMYEINSLIVITNECSKFSSIGGKSGYVLVIPSLFFHIQRDNNEEEGSQLSYAMENLLAETAKYFITGAASSATASTSDNSQALALESKYSGAYVTQGIIPATDKDKMAQRYYKYIYALGAPHQYGPATDLQYYTGGSEDPGPFPAGGRVFVKTIFSNPTILSILPGTVEYLPDVSDDQESKFWDKLITEMGADASSGDLGREFGRLFKFRSAYAEYITYVNFLCRLTAILMGIGDEKYPHSSVAIKNFDFTQFSNPFRLNNSQITGNVGIVDKVLGFTKFKEQIQSPLNIADQYIHFFVTGDGNSVSETFNTSIESSVFEEFFTGSLNGIQSTINFLFGGEVGGRNGGSMIDNSFVEGAINYVSSGLDGIASGIGGSIGNFIKGVTGVAGNYVRGGRLVFPKIIGDVSYDKSLHCTCHFRSLYGDKKSIFINCMVPVMHILAMALPKQLSANMYTFPFLVKANQPGFFASDLAVITNLNVERSASNSTNWTMDGLCTEVVCTFDITPLYSSLMVSSTKDGVMAMQNQSIFDYLGSICHVDIMAEDWYKKLEILKNIILNKFTDWPSNLGRSANEIIGNKVREWITFA